MNKQMDTKMLSSSMCQGLFQVKEKAVNKHVGKDRKNQLKRCGQHVL